MEPFVVCGKTKNGVPYSLAGIAADGAGEKAREEWLAYMKGHMFWGRTHVVKLDQQLLKFCMEGPTEGLLALGASVHWPGVPVRSGGIIGDPADEGESAEGNLERLKNGLWLCAHPGRFGAVFEAEEDEAQELAAQMERFTVGSNEKSVPQVEAMLREKCGCFILISDGSGPEGYCYGAAGKKE